MLKRLYILSFTLFIYSVALGQNNIPIGSWRTHFAVQSLSTIDWDRNSTVLAGSKNGLVRFNRSDNSFEALSKIDGFSDIEVSDIQYHQGLKIWVITYESGNIDILQQDNTVQNIDAIVRSTTITGSKKINQITLYNNLAYLSTDFGIVVLNLIKTEISESYTNIGKNAEVLQTSSCAIINDSIYIASNAGIRVASISDTINKMDYKSWSSVSYYNSTKIAKKLISTGDKLYAADKSGVFLYQNSSWLPISIPGTPIINSLNYTGSELIAYSNPFIYKIQTDNSIVSVQTNSAPLDGITIAANSNFLADSLSGILQIKNNSLSATLTPNSPAGQPSFRLAYYNNQIFCTAGGYDTKSRPAPVFLGFYRYKNGFWSNFIGQDISYPSVAATLDLTYNPVDKFYYFATFSGMVKWQEGIKYTMYDNTNSPFKDLYPDYKFIYNLGVATDKSGTVWASVSERKTTTDPMLFSMDKKGVWQSYNIPYNKLNQTTNLLVDDGNNKWIRVAPDQAFGLVVFNEKNPTGLQYRNLNDQTNTGGLTSPQVHCMALSQNGDMWIGTANGVNIISDAASVMKYSSNKNFYAVNATVPIYDSRALLRDKVVTAIKADGGDRKWIATTEGLWLFSPDGSEQLAFFNMDNSPLPSNNILSIEIEGETGEVFIATDKGIISYRSNATTGEKSNNGNVKVFPNPVRPDYSGPIAISGLVNQAVIKITDISGVLIFQTVANGGMATWNGNNMNGHKVAPGVYLIFSSDANGESGLVSKVAVLD